MFYLSDLFYDSFSYQPKTDLMETDTGIKLVTELPGIPKEDIDIQVKTNELNISVKSKDKKEGKLLWQERRPYSFSRSYTISDSLNKDSIKAKYTNGLLEVTLDKKKEAQSRQIKIE